MTFVSTHRVLLGENQAGARLAAPNLCTPIIGKGFTLYFICSSSTRVPRVFSRKSLLCNVFRCSACFPRVRVTHTHSSSHGRTRQNKFLIRATLAEQRNTLHSKHLARNTRGTHAEHTRRVRARAFSLPLFRFEKEELREIEKGGGMVCPVQQGDRRLAGRFRPSAGHQRNGRGGNGSSQGMTSTGHSNPAASVRRGVSMGVVW